MPVDDMSVEKNMNEMF